jgi:hypothetical protein
MRQLYCAAALLLTVSVAAAGAGEYGLTASSWKSMTLPVMYVTGTKDTGDKYSLLVKACGTAFLDLHLKGDKAAKWYLTKGGGFATFAGKAAELSVK